MQADGQTSSLLFQLKQKIKHFTRDYSNSILWEVLCKKYLPYNSEYKIVEVGCAPGKYLINFNTMFGYTPYGVEYSEKGVEITKENFRKAQLDPQGVVFADFFDPHFQEVSKGKYDVVFSRGFIEHFDDVTHVVDLHRNMVRRGGYVVIMIPNLNGVNKVIAKFLNKGSFDLHNTSIMNTNAFNALFPDTLYKKLYCGHLGLFSIGLFNTDKKWKYVAYRMLLLLQRPFDAFMRLCVPSGKWVSNYTSPYLLCIAQKI
jgi:2-polyprenyl-3-methyl-5-hydroxy-6-metoxy-1,4-benzoquinol methylase